MHNKHYVADFMQILANSDSDFGIWIPPHYITYANFLLWQPPHMHYNAESILVCIDVYHAELY